MKYLRFERNKEVKHGILEKNDLILELEGGYDSDPSPRRHHLREVKLLAPCQPSKIVAVGLNYRDHAAELKMAVSSQPIIFLKPGTSVIGPEENIIYPAMCQQLDYEGELALVIKKKCRDIKPENTADYILGYTCFNDVTARDLQRQDGQWTRAKSFDTFSPVGPWIVNGLNPENLKIELRLNGQIKQSSSTANLVFKVADLVSFISQVMTLLPGDIITTGTPPGVSAMNTGDIVEVEIEGIGVLRNKVSKVNGGSNAKE